MTSKNTNHQKCIVCDHDRSYHTDDGRCAFIRENGRLCPCHEIA